MKKLFGPWVLIGTGMHFVGSDLGYFVQFFARYNDARVECRALKNFYLGKYIYDNRIKAYDRPYSKVIEEYDNAEGTESFEVMTFLDFANAYPEIIAKIIKGEIDCFDLKQQEKSS